MSPERGALLLSICSRCQHHLFLKWTCNFRVVGFGNVGTMSYHIPYSDCVHSNDNNVRFIHIVDVTLALNLLNFNAQKLRNVATSVKRWFSFSVLTRTNVYRDDLRAYSVSLINDMFVTGISIVRCNRRTASLEMSKLLVNYHLRPVGVGHISDRRDAPHPFLNILMCTWTWWNIHSKVWNFYVCIC